MFRRRPKSPQGAGSPSATSKGAPHTAPADVEVRQGVAPPPSPRPAGSTLARIAAGTLVGADCGREIWVGAHVGHLIDLQQWHTAQRTILTLLTVEGIDVIEVSAWDAVIYQAEGAQP